MEIDIDDAGGGEVEEGEEVEEKNEWNARLETLEKDLQIIREEGNKMKLEIGDLRDRLEEEVWARARLEEKVKDLTEELKGAGENSGGGGGGVGERMVQNVDKMIEERKKEMKEVEGRLDARLKKVEERKEGRDGGGGREEGGETEGQNVARERKCVVLTDSNGSQVSSGSIMNHIPRAKRNEMEIDVVVAYTLDEAYRRIDRGEIDVVGAIVVIDDLTNDVRGTRSRPPTTPQQLVRLVDTLRRRVMAAGAEAVIVCQLKPMQTVDVTPFNEMLDNYLRRERERGRDGFACRTQIRLQYLKGDGYHIRPDFISIVDKTYACAFLGMDVPDPTPLDDFAPSYVRRRCEAEWPRLAGGGLQMTQNGR